MRFRDFRIGLRILMQDPAFSLVAILGLGVGLAACLLLLGFARYSWQYNAHVPDADHVYLIKQRQNMGDYADWTDQAPTLLRGAAEKTPGVAAASGFVNWLPLTVQADTQLRKLKSLTVLPGFAEMMGLRALKGDLNAALTQPDSFAITEKTALRLFGTTDVLGRTVRASSVQEQPASLRIAAVLRDPPANTTIPYEALNGVASALVPAEAKSEALIGANGWWGYLLVRLKPGASPEAVGESLQQAIDRAPAAQGIPPEVRARLGKRKAMDIMLSPLREAYFDTQLAPNRFSYEVDRGSRVVLVGLLIVAGLILLLAGINYVNLATIRVIRRQREISMRKVLGAGAPRLAGQFVAESLLLALLATALGLLLAWLALPLFGELTKRDLSGVLTASNIGAAALIGMLLGLLTAIYPAWIAFRVRPSQALAGRSDTEALGSRRLRQILTVLQIGVAMGLASFTLAVAWQTRFAMEASPGFDPAPLLIVDLPEAHAVRRSEQARSFIEALKREPGVVGVAVSTDAMGRSKNRWSTEMRREGGKGMPVDVKSVSANFFEQYGIRPVAGRLFEAGKDKENDSVPVVINALAARQFGFATPAEALGQTLLFRGEGEGQKDGMVSKRVVGIAPEIHFYSLREPSYPAAYELWTDGTTLSIRSALPLRQIERVVRRLWPAYFPNSVLEMRPAKDIYAANYDTDARVARMLTFATTIAFLIAGIGAYVLAADAVERRTREIALRKLFGAERAHIGRLVARELGVMVLLPALISLPLAAFIIAKFLASFAERAPIAYWAPVFALAIGLAMAALAGARQAWAAMGLNPAAALRV
ncbi:ABC transporter permease [Massilia sp. BJB1822]|uniref:ABC transporter permease n=1 Tax=Massilia sp. BJB1822 TaxID=2744470 RepID=UPI0015946D62|nr:ABC transporter permease [Massilia sp. BJB1822]NVE00592.1 ABC transporter permease [Massilia sp. BJB1822]